MATIATPVFEEEYAGGTIARAQVGLWRDGFRRLRRNRLALAALIYLILLLVVAVVAIFWTPYNPASIVPDTLTFLGPSAAHPLGTDELGRDLLSRMMQGAQISLIVGVGTSAVVLTVGVVVGLVAGYFRGWVDTVISVFINIFYGIPGILVAIILYLVLGRGLGNIMLAISATVWMDMARLVRGQAFSIREREFIEAARASGAKSGKILFGHILPNALGPIIVQATFVIPIAILTEAFLSYLGLGIPEPLASWGSIASEGYAALPLEPYMMLWPAIALSITLLAFNFLGDGLRDAFDPRQRR
jgi:oligopeptide transport system permease protein